MGRPPIYDGKLVMPELKSPLPCTDCHHPAADDVRHAIGNDAFRDGANLSPSGLPLQCCKIIQAAGTGPPAAAAVDISPARLRSPRGWPFGNRPQPPLRRT
jgi:hypothetical protein